MRPSRSSRVHVRTFIESHPDLFSAAEVHAIQLRGLSRADVGRLATYAAKRRLPDALTARIHERTAGNPFFVQQIVAALAERGELQQPPEELPIPLTVEAAVQSRLDLLPSAEKDLVKRAAIYRRPFSAPDVQALGPVEPGLLLRSLRRRDLVVPRKRGLFDFRSALTGHVAYRMLADDLRVALHRDAARWLETREDVDPEEVAHHHEEAGEGARAAECYARAVELATRRGDADSVLRASDAALRLGAPDALRYRLHIARVDALRFRSRKAQMAELDAALRYVSDDRQRARVLSDRCIALSRSGAGEEAEKVGTEAVAAARAAGDPALIAIALGRLALALVQSGDPERARELLAECALVSEGQAPELRAMVLDWRAQVAGASGDLGTRMRAYASAAELHELVGDARRAAGARANLADIHNRLGAYADAVNALTAAREACRAVGHRVMEGYVLLNLGYSQAGLGETEASQASLDGAAHLAQATGEVRLALLCDAYRARTLALASRHEDAFEVGQRTAEAARAAGIDTVAVMAEVSAARAALALGRVEAAEAIARRAYESCVALGGVEEDETDVYLTYAHALSAAGRKEDAAEVIAEGHRRLLAQADGLLDGELRRALLEDVPAHRALIAEHAGD